MTEIRPKLILLQSSLPWMRKAKIQQKLSFNRYQNSQETDGATNESASHIFEKMCFKDDIRTESGQEDGRGNQFRQAVTGTVPQAQSTDIVSEVRLLPKADTASRTQLL